MTTSAFSDLPLNAGLLAALDSLEYHTMTPIQAQTLPLMLAGQDVIAQAKTGSGKTAAFALALLQRLQPKAFHCQCLLLCPTRELADQVAREIRRLARELGNIKVLTLCGGAAMGPQVSSLESGGQIIVGTPGRVQKHLDKGSLSLQGVDCLVLDEADRMLDMGFYDSIAAIISRAPLARQTLLFSATYPPAIEELAGRFLRDPQRVTVAVQHDGSKIVQQFYEVAPRQRREAVLTVLKSLRPTSCVAFCATRQQCDELVTLLVAEGIHARALHGDMEQRDRDQVLAMFANRSLSVLVATDVAARGLDIDALELVINVELAWDPDTHIHRVGRTGRGDDSGLAVSLVAPAEARRAMAIEDVQKAPLQWRALSELAVTDHSPLLPPMASLQIGAGRKDKLRPGDILGALTGAAGLAGDQVGKIAVFDHHAVVAVQRALGRQALAGLRDGKVKGRRLRVTLLD